jgi:RND family efflux transporter MFP subunit
MNKVNSLLIGIVILGGGASAGCRRGGPLGNTTANSPNTAARPIAVKVADAMPSTAAGELLIPAALSVEGRAVVLAQRDGTIIKLAGQEGTRVTKGAIIAQLGGDDDLRAQLRQAQLEVNRLKVEEREYEALIKVNRNELERETTLAKDGISSPRDVERAQYRLDATLLELEKTRVAGQTAQSKVSGAEIELAKSIVRAPMTGIVMHRFATLGTNVVKNDKLFEITQLAPLEVKFQLPQTERAGLGPGGVISLSLVDADQIVARARIRRIAPVADAASNTLGYLADVIGGKGLMPGMAVNVRFPRATVGSTLWIPRAAFPPGADLRNGVAGTLFVVDGERSAARAVWVNAVQGDLVEIISGLSQGERVILSPPVDLKAGDLVEIKN